MPDVKYVRGADGKLAYKYISYKRLEPYASVLICSQLTLQEVTGLLGEEALLEKEAIQQVVSSCYV